MSFCRIVNINEAEITVKKMLVWYTDIMNEMAEKLIKEQSSWKKKTK